VTSYLGYKSIGLVLCNEPKRYAIVFVVEEAAASFAGGALF